MTDQKFSYKGEPVRFVNDHAVLYDAKGNEIKEPRCKTCGQVMNPVMGKLATAWHCNKHGFQ